MKNLRYIYWQDGEMWLGYLEEFPDYQTQGESLSELRDNLKDLYQELTGAPFQTCGGREDSGSHEKNRSYSQN